jgi:hypothetical protein
MAKTIQIDEKLFDDIREVTFSLMNLIDSIEEIMGADDELEAEVKPNPNRMNQKRYEEWRRTKKE